MYCSTCNVERSACFCVLEWHNLNSRYCLAYVAFYNMSLSIIEFILLTYFCKNGNFLRLYSIVYSMFVLMLLKRFSYSGSLSQIAFLNKNDVILQHQCNYMPKCIYKIFRETWKLVCLSYKNMREPKTSVVWRLKLTQIILPKPAKY